MQYLDETSNFLAIEKQYSDFEHSKIAILSAPYEHTVSYGEGAGKGPEAILEASAFVEFYDDEFDKELCFEQGITTIEPLNFENLKDKDALDYLQSNVKSLLDANKFVVTLGGEHTISFAPFAAHLEKYSDLCILQFDAHSDLRDTYQDSKYSHASVMARIAEIIDPSKITQVGIRAQCIEESEFIKKNNVNTFYSSAIRRNLHGQNWQKKVVDTLSDNIYVTFDVDYFDPSIMPATGTPEPDGFFYSETLDVFREIIKQGKQIVGFDVVELAPMEGLKHPDLTTARLIYKMLNFAFANK